MWLAKVGDATGKPVEVDWQPFSLGQVNNDKGPDYKIWEQPEILDGTDKSLLAHQAGLAAKRQGKEAFESFFITLLKARHEDKKDLTDPAVIEEAGIKSGIDMAQFLEDVADTGLLGGLGEGTAKGGGG